MPSADPSRCVATLLEQLTRRLDCAHEIALVTRGQLARAATEDIDASIARLETVAQEFKLLVEEYDRLPLGAGDHDPRVAEARRALDRAVANIARSSAISGGLLERLILVSRRRLELLDSAVEGTYKSNGRSAEFDARGLRLKERV